MPVAAVAVVGGAIISGVMSSDAAQKAARAAIEAARINQATQLAIADHQGKLQTDLQQNQILAQARMQQDSQVFSMVMNTRQNIFAMMMNAQNSDSKMATLIEGSNQQRLSLLIQSRAKQQEMITAGQQRHLAWVLEQQRYLLHNADTTQPAIAPDPIPADPAATGQSLTDLGAAAVSLTMGAATVDAQHELNELVNQTLNMQAATSADFGLPKSDTNEPARQDYHNEDSAFLDRI